MPAAIRFLDILRALHRHEVEFVVGGVAAILEGAPVSTFDLDIMHERSGENHRRLLAALQELNSRYSDPAGRTILPDLLKLETLRLHRLITDSGPLDILTEMAPGLSYQDVVADTVVYSPAGLEIRVLAAGSRHPIEGACRSGQGPGRAAAATRRGHSARADALRC